MRWLLTVSLIAAIGCAHRGGGGAAITLRAACPDGQRWSGAACVVRDPAIAGALDDSAAALADGDLARADAAIARAAAAAPLDHASNVRLWEHRGLVEAYRMFGDRTPAKAAATAASYRHLLAIDPAHRLDCRLADKATSPFEEARAEAARRGVPELQVTWPRNLRLGEPVPVEIETVADPDGLLHTATLYVRERGASTWRAADVPLSPPGQYTRVRLPPIAGTAASALELYATGLDRDGNETLLWATALRPREIPLRYDPPTPWYRLWWVWAIAGGVVATGAGVVTYALVWEPSGSIDGIIR